MQYTLYTLHDNIFNYPSCVLCEQKFDDIAASLRSDDAQEPSFMGEVHAQFYVFRHWASEKILMQRFSHLLSVGGIPSKISDAHMADLNDLDCAMNDAAKDKKYPFSNKGEMTIRFASQIMNMRRLYNARDWNALDTLLSSFSSDQLDAIVAAFPSSMEEIENCRWLVQYHLTLGSLRAFCIAPSFSLVPIEQGDFSGLKAGLQEAKAVIAKARTMNLEDEVIFSAMLDLASHAVQIRESLADKRPDAGELFGRIKEHRALAQVPMYLPELDVCALLLAIVKCETQLRSALESNAIHWKIVDGVLSILCPREGSLQLEIALNNIDKLRRCPKKLQQVAHTVRASVLRARTLVHEMNCEDDANGKVDSISRPTSPVPGHSKYRSSYPELRSIEALLQVISDLRGIDLRDLSTACTTEVETALLHLGRRQMSFSYHFVLSNRCINGTVGNIVVRAEDIEYSKLIYQKVNVDVDMCRSRIYSDVFIPAGKEKEAFVSAFFVHLYELKALCELTLTVREYARDENWADINELWASQDHKIDEFVENSIELRLVQHEIEHLNLIRDMKLSIEQLEITLIANSANLNPSPSVVHYEKLTAVLDLAVVVGCHNELSVKLKSVCIVVKTALSLIKEGRTHEISLSEVQSSLHATKELGLDSSKLFIVLSYIRSHQIVHKLYVTVAATTDSRSLYIALLKANAACEDKVGDDLRCWIDITEDLRMLRVWRNNEEWTEVLEHSKNMQLAIAAIPCFSEEQQAFCMLLEEQRSSIRREAIAVKSSTHLQLTALTAKIGPLGTTSYCTPELGVKMLKKVVDNLDSTPLNDREVDSKTTENVQKMRALLNLRESVLDEVSVCSRLPARRQSRKLRDTDMTGEGGEEGTLKVNLSSASIGRIHSARERTFSVLDTAVRSSDSTEMTSECMFVSDTANLINMLERLEQAALQPVVRWDDESNQVEFQDGNSKVQLDAISALRNAFPEKSEGIHLVQVCSYHT